MNGVGEREKTREISLDRAKSIFYFLTTAYIPSLRMYPRYKMLTHAYTGLVYITSVCPLRTRCFLHSVSIINLCALSFGLGAYEHFM